MLKDFPADIEAVITFLTFEEGGRKTPVFSGYRPQFYYDGHDWDAAQNYVGVLEVHPGQTATAQLIFMSPQYPLGVCRNNLFDSRLKEIEEGL